MRHILYVSCRMHTMKMKKTAIKQFFGSEFVEQKPRDKDDKTQFTPLIVFVIKRKSVFVTKNTYLWGLLWTACGPGAGVGGRGKGTRWPLQPSPAPPQPSLNQLISPTSKLYFLRQQKYIFLECKKMKLKDNQVALLDHHQQNQLVEIPQQLEKYRAEPLLSMTKATREGRAGVMEHKAVFLYFCFCMFL